MQHTALGWEARDRLALIEWAIAAYPGPGGLRTGWWRGDALTDQVRDLSRPGVLLSDMWAAAKSWRLTPASRLTIYTRKHPDMEALGFTSAERGEDTVSVIVPADETIFATTAGGGTSGLTDKFITAATIIHSASGLGAREVDAVDTLRWLLHLGAETEYDLRWNLPD